MLSDKFLTRGIKLLKNVEGEASEIQRDKTMDDILINNPNDYKQNYPSVDQNWWLKCLVTQLNSQLNNIQ